MKLLRSPAAKSFILFTSVLMMVVVSCSRVLADDLPAAVTDELDKLEKKRQMELAESRKPLTDLANSYVAELERAKGAAQVAGDLKKVLATEEEIRLAKADVVLDHKIEDTELASLNKTYSENLAKRKEEVMGKMREVERNHADALAGFVRDLTKAGMIAEAKHVQGLEQAVRESVKEITTGIPERPTPESPNMQRAPEGFALIPAGNFQMGDTFAEGFDEERPVHRVNVSAFYMAKHETTKALWDEVRTWGLKNGYTDLAAGLGKKANHPVHTVSWYDIVKWCNARSQKDGLIPCYTVNGAVYKTGENSEVTCDFAASGYRLPTEAEWEKAARGGVSGQRFPWGDEINISHANYRANGSAYTYDTSLFTTFTYHPTYNDGIFPYSSSVGSFAPNGYGLYDMAGNMWEWCWDWYGTYPSTSQSDPRGPASGSRRVRRGGSWVTYAVNCRAAIRIYYTPTLRDNGIGFRTARSSVPQ